MEHILVGTNHKTRCSVNFGLSTCSPTPWCSAHCYARLRSKDTAEALGSTGNSGPVTWPKQQAAYERNVTATKELYRTGNEAVREEAVRIVTGLRRQGLDNIRWNGVGDLFNEVLPLIGHIAAFGILVWGFSRKARQIVELSDLCTLWGVATRPMFLGSIDPTTTPLQGLALVEATEELCGEPRLAYATAAEGAAGAAETDAHVLREYFKVVFGYHTHMKRTTLGHPLECEATSGEVEEEGYCQECKRCMI